MSDVQEHHQTEAIMGIVLKLESVLDTLAYLFMNAAAVLLAGMTGLILFQVLLRATLGTAPIWINDLTTYTAVWIVFLLMGVLVWNDEHLSIRFFYWKLPERWQRYVRSIQLLLIMALSVEFAYLGYEYAVTSGLQSLSPTLGVHMFWMYISTAVGGMVLLLFIKMEYENTQAGLLNAHALPEWTRWPQLTSRSGLALLDYYKQMLLDLTKSDDPLIAAIYADAQTRLREPRHLGS
jgi:TRAP-type C4-dicarboxylate transport system permease small subunit